MNCTAKDKLYMQRCIELASLGGGRTSSNPKVGSVIVYNNKIIGEGFHRKYGEAHAEVNAINSVKQKELLKKATLYVNLEPCSHHGKTPPCSDLIVKEGIPKVVIGCIDTFSKVAGKGIEKLKNAGCEVTTGILETESRELNKRFFTHHEKKRPYIILKWAQTLDGFIDIKRPSNAPKQPTWITNELTRMLVHKWRDEEDSILIGSNTAIQDNPKLNIRDWAGTSPTRILIDPFLEAPQTINLYDGNIKTIIIIDKNCKNKPNYLTKQNIDFKLVDFGSINVIQQILDLLHKQNLLSLIVEGGAHTLQQFIDQGIWDEARIFYGNKIFVSGIKAPKIKGKIETKTRLWESELLIMKKTNL